MKKLGGQSSITTVARWRERSATVRNERQVLNRNRMFIIEGQVGHIDPDELTIEDCERLEELRDRLADMEARAIARIKSEGVE